MRHAFYPGVPVSATPVPNDWGNGRTYNSTIQLNRVWLISYLLALGMQLLSLDLIRRWPHWKRPRMENAKGHALGQSVAF